MSAPRGPQMQLTGPTMQSDQRLSGSGGQQSAGQKAGPATESVARPAWQTEGQQSSGGQGGSGAGGGGGNTMESIAPATTQMGGQSRTVTMRSDPRMVAASVAVNPAAAAMQALQGQAGSGEAGGVPGDKNYTGGGVYVPGIPYPVSPSSLTPEMLKKAKAWGGSASSAASLKSAVDGLGVPKQPAGKLSDLQAIGG